MKHYGMTWADTAALSLREVNYLIDLLNEEHDAQAKQQREPKGGPLPQGVKRVPVIS